jgi:hypothetical protein
VAAPQVAGLPPFFILKSGYTVRVTAQDPTSGAVVTGVIVSNVSLAVDPDDSSPVVPKAQPVVLIAGTAA